MFKWIAGFLTTILSGVILWWLTQPGSIINPPPPPPPQKPQFLNINYSMIGNPLPYIGSYSKRISPISAGAKWYQYYISVENNCKTNIILDPSKFKMGNRYIPSGRDKLKGKLKPISLQSGERAEGKLYFEAFSNGKIRYTESTPCKQKYN